MLALTPREPGTYLDPGGCLCSLGNTMLCKGWILNDRPG